MFIRYLYFVGIIVQTPAKGKAKQSNSTPTGAATEQKVSENGSIKENKANASHPNTRTSSTTTSTTTNKSESGSGGAPLKTSKPTLTNGTDNGIRDELTIDTNVDRTDTLSPKELTPNKTAALSPRQCSPGLCHLS